MSDKPTAGNQLRRGGLGRGLASLIPAGAPATTETSTVAIDAIRPNPYQPRTEWDEERLQELPSRSRRTD